MPRRSYDQYCAVARALDTAGDRWTLLIVRELLGGPRRYTDLHADLPGVSTDMLATRLREMEADGLATRRRLPPPGNASVYQLTPRGRGLLPVLAALAAFGAPELGPPRPTDAVRAHWYAIPLLTLLAETGDRDGDGDGDGSRDGDRDGDGFGRVVEVRLDAGTFHLLLDGPDGPGYGDGPAPDAGTRLETTAAVCAALARGATTLDDALAAGEITVTRDGAPLAAAPTA